MTQNSASGSRQDKQTASYVESPVRAGKTSKEVVSYPYSLDPNDQPTQQTQGGYKDEFSSNTLLNAGESFSSGIVDINGYSYLETEIFSDVDGQLMGVWYEDDQTTIIRSFVFPYSAAEELALIGTRSLARYLKYVYTNTSGINQSSFQFRVRLTNIPMTGQLLRVNQFIPENVLSQLTRSVLVGLSSANEYKNVGVNDVGALNTSDFLLDVAQGKYPSYSINTKFGRNPDSDTGTTPEDVWSGGDFYTGMPITGSALQLSIQSSDANDSAAGSGARTVRIEGLDSAYNKVSEILILDGTNPVLTANFYWRHVRTYVLSGGATGANEGIITGFWNGVPAQIFIDIPMGSNQTSTACDTVPNGKTRIITNLYSTISRASGAAGSANHRLLIREEGGVFRTVRDIEVTTGQPYIPNMNAQIVVPSKSDMKWQVYSVSDNNTISTGEFEFVDIDSESFIELDQGGLILQEDGGLLIV